MAERESVAVMSGAAEMLGPILKVLVYRVLELKRFLGRFVVIKSPAEFLDAELVKGQPGNHRVKDTLRNGSIDGLQVALVPVAIEPIVNYPAAIGQMAAIPNYSLANKIELD